MADEPDGVNEALHASTRVALTVGGLVAERMMRAREQAHREAEAASQQEARELANRLDAERAAARAQLAPVAQDDWWDRAGPHDIGLAWETAKAWEHADPDASRTVDHMRDELRRRYAIDTDSLDADPAAVQDALERRERALRLAAEAREQARVDDAIAVPLMVGANAADREQDRDRGGARRSAPRIATAARRCTTAPTVAATSPTASNTSPTRRPSRRACSPTPTRADPPRTPWPKDHAARRRRAGRAARAARRAARPGAPSGAGSRWPKERRAHHVSGACLEIATQRLTWTREDAGARCGAGPVRVGTHRAHDDSGRAAQASAANLDLLGTRSERAGDRRARSTRGAKPCSGDVDRRDRGHSTASALTSSPTSSTIETRLGVDPAPRGHCSAPAASSCSTIDKWGAEDVDPLPADELLRRQRRRLSRPPAPRRDDARRRRRRSCGRGDRGRRAGRPAVDAVRAIPDDRGSRAASARGESRCQPGCNCVAITAGSAWRRVMHHARRRVRPHSPSMPRASRCSAHAMPGSEAAIGRPRARQPQRRRGLLHELGHPEEKAVLQFASRVDRARRRHRRRNAPARQRDPPHGRFVCHIDAEYLDAVSQDPAEAAAGSRLEHPDHPRYLRDPWTTASGIADPPLTTLTPPTAIEAWRDATIATERDRQHRRARAHEPGATGARSGPRIGPADSQRRA